MIQISWTIKHAYRSINFKPFLKGTHTDVAQTILAVLLTCLPNRFDYYFCIAITASNVLRDFVQLRGLVGSGDEASWGLGKKTKLRCVLVL